MAWKPKRKKWDWRKHLTAEEAGIIREWDAHQKEMESRHKSMKNMAADVNLIRNRAIQRAKYEARAK